MKNMSTVGDSMKKHFSTVGNNMKTVKGRYQHEKMFSGGCQHGTVSMVATHIKMLSTVGTNTNCFSTVGNKHGKTNCLIYRALALKNNIVTKTKSTIRIQM